MQSAGPGPMRVVDSRQRDARLLTDRQSTQPRRMHMVDNRQRDPRPQVDTVDSDTVDSHESQAVESSSHDCIGEGMGYIRTALQHVSSLSLWSILTIQPELLVTTLICCGSDLLSSPRKPTNACVTPSGHLRS